MKRIALSLLLAGAAFAVQAQSPAGTAAPADGAAPAVESAPADAAAAPTETNANVPAKAKSDDITCLRETGTRTKRRDAAGCTGAAGRTYSRGDLHRTGATDTADAIRKLHPAAGHGTAGN